MCFTDVYISMLIEFMYVVSQFYTYIHGYIFTELMGYQSDSYFCSFSRLQRVCMKNCGKKKKYHKA